MIQLSNLIAHKRQKTPRGLLSRTDLRVLKFAS